MPTVAEVLDRVLLPALLLIAGTTLVLAGERDVGLALIFLGAGVPLPQKASGLLGRKA